MDIDNVKEIYSVFGEVRIKDLEEVHKRCFVTYSELGDYVLCQVYAAAGSPLTGGRGNKSIDGRKAKRVAYLRAITQLRQIE